MFNLSIFRQSPVINTIVELQSDILYFRFVEKTLE